MKNILKQEILKLKNRPHVNQEILEKFLQKLEDKKGLFRFENPQDHICAYFLPFNTSAARRIPPVSALGDEPPPRCRIGVAQPRMKNPPTSRRGGFNQKSRSIYPAPESRCWVYLGHHKKAGCWIPPGGHIEKNESPVETIKREFSEELAHRVTDDQIELFDLTITDIVNPIQVCKRHWDLWHLVYVDKIDFVFDKREFYEAAWFSVEKALPLIEIKTYRKTIEKLLSLF